MHSFVWPSCGVLLYHQFSVDFVEWYYILMAPCKTAATPVRKHWSCCSLALSHRFVLITASVASLVQSQNCHYVSEVTLRDRDRIDRSGIPHKNTMDCEFYGLHHMRRLGSILYKISFGNNHSIVVKHVASILISNYFLSVFRRALVNAW